MSFFADLNNLWYTVTASHTVPWIIHSCITWVAFLLHQHGQLGVYCSLMENKYILYTCWNKLTLTIIVITQCNVLVTFNSVYSSWTTLWWLFRKGILWCFSPILPVFPLPCQLSASTEVPCDSHWTQIQCDNAGAQTDGVYLHHSRVSTHFLHCQVNRKKNYWTFKFIPSLIFLTILHLHEKLSCLVGSLFCHLFHFSEIYEQSNEQIKTPWKQ